MIDFADAPHGPWRKLDDSAVCHDNTIADLVALREGGVFDEVSALAMDGDQRLRLHPFIHEREFFAAGMSGDMDAGGRCAR